MYLSMAMLLDCPPVPVLEVEKSEITAAAYSARSESTAESEFESISVTKCVTTWVWEEPERVQGRTERVSFYGLFPHTTQTNSYRERYSIRCHKSVDYRGDSVIDQIDDCSEELERYMQYDGLNHEVRLRGSVSVDDATAYLNYLMQYDFGKENQTRVNEGLRKIQWVELAGSKEFPRFRASFAHGGCAVTTLESTAIREDPLVFGEVDGHITIC